MLIITDINPLLEAVTYFTDRANGRPISDRYLALIREHPDKQRELFSMLSPTMTLEKELNANLNIKEERISFFFKRIAGMPVSRFLDRNIATLFLLVHMSVPFSSMLEIRAALMQNTLEQKIISFECGFLSSSTDKAEEINISQFFRYIDNLPVSYESKINIFRAINDYEAFVDELFSILTPAVELIQKKRKLYLPLLTEFSNTYRDVEDVHTEIAKHTNIWSLNCEDTYLRPYIMGFDSYLVSYYPGESFNIDKKYTDTAKHITLGVYKGKMFDINSASITPKSLAIPLKVLADANRMEILFYLKTNVAYGQEIAEKFNLVPPNVSHHISKLQAAGFVDGTLESGKIYYTINYHNISAFLDKVKYVLCDIL
ncbi:MAG: winged helix-turn-helix domain-containing protein [Clostridia bacterium]